jgi:hypothetical protein
MQSYYETNMNIGTFISNGWGELHIVVSFDVFGQTHKSININQGINKLAWKNDNQNLIKLIIYYLTNLDILFSISVLSV